MLESITRVYENVSPPTASVLRLRGAPDVLEGSLSVTPVCINEDSVFGAEISGVDWSKPVPDEIVEQVSCNN